MQAITIENGNLVFCPDHEDPRPVDDEIVVQVIQAGICETDLQLARGYMGFSGVLGHEFVAVAQAGPLAGRRVVGEINCNCRHCPRCRDGLGNHCDRRTVIGIDRHDGAFAEFVSIPQHNLHVVPDSVSDDQAVFVEPLAAAFQICQQVQLSANDRVVVLGDGRLAYLCAQAIATEVDQDNIMVIGKHPPKLARFQSLGMKTRQLGDSQDLAKKSFDVAVDCTGSATGLPAALELVRPRGTVVMKTTIAAKHDLSLAEIVIDEINLVGSRCGPFDVALNALQNQTIDVDALITHRFPLSEAAQAMKTATDPAAFKVVFDICPSEKN